MRTQRASDSIPAASGRLSPAEPYRRWKQAGLLMLAIAWITLGLVGHDPWKFDDATNFGIAWEMNQSGDYIVPRLAGEAYLVRPPLVPAAAALSQRLLSPPLEPYDAARVVAGVALALTLLFSALAIGELAGPECHWLPVLLLIGTVGLWDRAHVLSGELGAMTGIAIGLYGLALALRRPVGGGAWLGAGAAIAFLAEGLQSPARLALASLLLPLAGATWRRREFALTLVVALAVALGIASPWLIAFHLRDSVAFGAWVAAQSAPNFFAFASGAESAAPLYFLQNLLWFAWPELPLIAWMLWTRGRGFNGGLTQPAVVLPGILALVIFADLLVTPDPKLIEALPLLVPLALLATLEVDSLKRGYSAALDWFGILTFGLLAIVVWGLWIDARLYGMPAVVAALFRDTVTGFRPSFHLEAVAAAVFLTLLWVALVRPARRSNRRALLNWAAGVTLVWCLYSTIWLPYLDSRRSYRHLAEAVRAHLPDQGCVASRNLGDPQRALFQYFAHLVTLREETHPDVDCPTLLVQYGPLAGPPPQLPGWRVEWEGSRRGDATERFVLYAKDES